MTEHWSLDEFVQRLNAADYVGAVRWLRNHPGAIDVATVPHVDIGEARILVGQLQGVTTAHSEADAIYRLGIELWDQDGAELLALHVLEAAAQEGSLKARAAYGESLHWFGSHDHALPWLERAVGAPATDSAWLRGLLGETYLAHGRLLEAVELLDHAASDHPEFGIPLAKALVASERDAEAVELLRSSVEAGLYGAAILLGNILDQQGDESGAETAYRAGVETADAHSAFNLGLLYERQGRSAAAREAFGRARAMGDRWVSPAEARELNDESP